MVLPTNKTYKQNIYLENVMYSFSSALSDRNRQNSFSNVTWFNVQMKYKTIGPTNNIKRKRFTCSLAWYTFYRVDIEVHVFTANFLYYDRKIIKMSGTAWGFPAMLIREISVVRYCQVSILQKKQWTKQNPRKETPQTFHATIYFSYWETLCKKIWLVCILHRS